MKNKKAFTLIEVLGVLVILSLIITIIIIEYTGTIRNSRVKLNEEQKTRLVEVAKDASLLNKDCLNIARTNTSGSKITLDAMKSNGLIKNQELKDLVTGENLNSCVIIKYNTETKDYTYEFSDNCSSATSCVITTKDSNVIISGFSLVNPTSTGTGYLINYSSSIEAEYCITTNESCEWIPLDKSEKIESGLANIPADAETVKLYIRDENENIISSEEVKYKPDNSEPVCTWGDFDRTTITKGSSAVITLSCSDESGIETEVIKSTDLIFDSSLISVSDSMLTENRNTKMYRFIVTGNTGNGATTLKLKTGVLKDSKGNAVNTVKESSNITVDNGLPDATITVPARTNSTTITVGLSNVSGDLDEVCIRNSMDEICYFEPYQTSYNFELQGPSGDKKVYVSLKDKAGNIATKEATTHLEITIPVCIVTPVKLDNYIKQNDYNEFIINCVDENNKSLSKTITASMLEYNSLVSAIEVVETTASGTRIRVKANSGEGRAEVTLKANQVVSNGKGNKQTNITRFNVDNTAPTCTFSTGPTIDIGSTGTIELTCTDAGSGLDNINLTASSFNLSNDKISVVSVAAGTDVAGGKSFIVTLTATDNGSTTLSLKSGAVKDKAKNDASASQTVLGRRTLTVTFNKNVSAATGSTGSTSCKITVEESCDVTLPANGFAYEGWTFYRWGTSKTATSGTAAGGTYAVSANTTLYAVWRKKITLKVTYNKNVSAATGTTAATTCYYYGYNGDTTGNCDNTLAANGFTYDGWTFYRWGTSKTATSGTAAGGTKNISANTTLYAVWRKKVTRKVTYNKTATDATGTTAATSCYFYVYNGADTTGSCDATLADNGFTLSGWTFKAWGTSKTATSGTAAGGTLSISANTTLYAVWKKTRKATFYCCRPEYTCTGLAPDALTCTAYAKNGDTSSTCNVTMPENVSCKRTGLSFIAWIYTLDTGEEKFMYPGEKVALWKNKSFYASHWDGGSSGGDSGGGDVDSWTCVRTCTNNGQTISNTAGPYYDSVCGGNCHNGSYSYTGSSVYCTAACYKN